MYLAQINAKYILTFVYI